MSEQRIVEVRRMTRLLFRLRLRRLPVLRTEAEVLAALRQPTPFYAELRR